MSKREGRSRTKKPKKIVNEEDTQILQEIKQDQDKMSESKKKDENISAFADKMKLNIVQTPKDIDDDDEDDEDWGDIPSVQKQ